MHMCIYTHMYVHRFMPLSYSGVRVVWTYKTTRTSIGCIPPSLTFCKSYCKFPLFLPSFQNSPSGLNVIFVLRFFDKLEDKHANFLLMHGYSGFQLIFVSILVSYLCQRLCSFHLSYQIYWNNFVYNILL